MQLPSASGYEVLLQNLGKIKNEGWEFVLNTKNLTRAFRWSTDFNISFNTNKVLALGARKETRSASSGQPNTHITAIGHPAGSYFGFQQEGIFLNEEELTRYPVVPGRNGSRAGDIRYKDVNGDGVITPDDRTIIGNALPDFIYGMTHTFSFKNFDLSVLLQGVQGMDVFNLTLTGLGHLQSTRNNRGDYADRWRSAEQPGKYFRANRAPTGFNTEVSSRMVEDGSYLNIRTVSFGYSLPAAAAKKIFLGRLRVYANVQNAWIFTRYLNYNPEASFGQDNPLTPGVDLGGYPLNRMYTLELP